MKFSKIFVSLVALSATGVATLVSCGGGGSPAQTPSVYVYARTSVNAEKKAEKSTVSRGEGPQVYYDDEVLTYTVENAENLRYGEQDVVVHIEPRPFFHLTEGYNSETWKAEGDPVIPYVGLGSPNNRYSYELPMNVAWTYEREESETAERYKLVVKKEFFQKNIVVGYGYAKNGVDEDKINNYAKVVTSTVYEEEIKSFSLETIKNLTKDSEIPEEDMNNFISYRSGGSDFSVVSEGMTLVYGSSDSYKNKLMTLGSIPSTLTESGTEYAQIVVYGVQYDNADHPAKFTAVDKLSYYSDTDDSPFVVRRVGSFDDDIAVFIDWDSLIKDHITYNQKYDDIYIGIDPIYACDVSVSGAAKTDGFDCLNSGYCYGDSQVTGAPEAGTPFTPYSFKFKDYQDDFPYGYYYYDSVENICPDNYGSGCAPYFVTFTYKQDGTKEGVEWPTVTISYTDADGQTASIQLVTSKDRVYTASNCQYITELANPTDLTNPLNEAKWELINIQKDSKISNRFVLYSAHRADTDAFVSPTEWSLAKSVNINISK